MTVSVLGPAGVPRAPYGSFANKPPATGGSKTWVQDFSVLGPAGVPRPPYASFAGKGGGGGSKVWVQDFSVLGPAGVPRPPYSGFAGKYATRPLVSVLGPAGVPRPPYGAFGGKQPSGGAQIFRKTIYGRIGLVRFTKM